MRGIDICYHQGDIDFGKAKQDGIDFIFPRDGWGTSKIDPKLVEYVKNAKASGISVPGVYHFIYALNIQQAIENAYRAIQNVVKAGLPKTTIIWCDLEYDTVDNAKAQGVILTPKDQRNFAEAFCNYVLAQGYPTGIYCNADYLVNIYGRDIIDSYDIWLADLEDDPDYPCLYRQDGWHGRISGIPTDVDTDVWIGQYTAGTAKAKGGDMAKKYYTETELVYTLKKLASGNPPSSYRNKFPYNLLYWDGSRWWADCVNLYKALFNGRQIDNPVAGSYQEDLSNTGDVDEWGMMEQCSDISTDFSTLGNKFECLYLPGHFGGYLGAEWNEPGQGIVNCVECTNLWEGGIQYSYVDKYGNRYWCKGGEHAAKDWTHHGVPDAFVDYDEIMPEPEPVEITIPMNKFISFLPVIQKGSTGDCVKLLQNCLTILGFYYDAVDGSAGPNTAKAIKAYQTAAGLSPDGFFGPKSWTKLLIG